MRMVLLLFDFGIFLVLGTMSRTARAVSAIFFDANLSFYRGHGPYRRACESLLRSRRHRNSYFSGNSFGAATPAPSHRGQHPELEIQPSIRKTNFQ